MITQREIKRLTAAFMVVVSLALLAPVPATAEQSLPDVKSDAWYYEYVTLCTKYGIIDGREDGLYHPEADLLRGEFMKLVCYIGEIPAMTSSNLHWAAPYWQALRDTGVLWGLELADMQADASLVKALNASITRYEMCMIIKNLCFNIYGENAVQMNAPESRIGDYDRINSKYQESVIQAFGKGILDGYDDGEFKGDNTMSRAQAAAVIVRTGWPARRLEVSAVDEIVDSGTGSEGGNSGEAGGSGGGDSILAPEDSFAFRYRSMSTAEQQQILFGSSSKSYFTGSEPNLGEYIVTVEVPTWYLNPNGSKTSKTRTIQVNRAVADEVRAIFQEIYNDPEQFPIKALGGARFTDTMRHAWGCAIDINPVENYYVNTTTWTALTGSTCYKFSDSPYCIRPDSSVVRAFAKYGWGWGGGTAENDYTGWRTTADYMHFSILASGG